MQELPFEVDTAPEPEPAVTPKPAPEPEEEEDEEQEPTALYRLKNWLNNLMKEVTE